MTSNAVPKVLIADDDRDVLSLLSHQCASMGFEVRTASNGLQALLIAGRMGPDVLIADVNMPELDGLAVCGRLLDPERKDMEVVIVSGGRSAEIVERCESFGAVYVRKGLNFLNDVRDALVEIFPEMGGDANPAAARPLPQVNVRQRPIVLLVDDDPDVADFLRSRLRKFGADMVHAGSGAEGFRLACRHRPNIIVSDFHMPGGDGLFLLRRLQADPSASGIPVLLLTGRDIDVAMKHELTRAVPLKSGGLRIIRKAPDMMELFDALQRFLPVPAPL
jgi:CheY-like chemotaxis protein